jgi:hypothetical protein
MFEKDLAHTMKQQRLLLQKDKQRERELGVTLGVFYITLNNFRTTSNPSLAAP